MKFKKKSTTTNLRKEKKFKHIVTNESIFH